MSELDQAVEIEAAETAAEVAENVAEVVAEEAAADAVEELAEQVIEHIDATLDEIEEVVETQEEDEQWLRLQNEILASEQRILTGVKALLNPSSPSEENLEQTVEEVLEEAEEELAEAEVLEFDPVEAAPEPGDEVAPKRKVRGLRKRR